MVNQSLRRRALLPAQAFKALSELFDEQASSSGFASHVQALEQPDADREIKDREQDQSDQLESDILYPRAQGEDFVERHDGM